MAVLSTNSVSNFIPEIWSRKLLKRYDNLVVMTKLVNREHEGEVSQSGDLIHVRLVGDISISSYSRDTAISAQTLTSTDETMSIDQQKYFYFTLDVMDERQSDIPIIEQYKERGAIGIRDVVDTHLLSHYADTDATNIIGTATAPVTLTSTNIAFYFLWMGKLLDDQKVPQEGRNVVVTPHVKRLILENLQNRNTPLGDEVTKNGKLISDFCGFTVYVSTNVPTATNSKPILFFTKDFISFAEQLKKVESFTLTSEGFGTGVKGVFLYGSKSFVAQDGTGAVLYSAVA